MINHYRVLRKLGAGGMGEVYLAEDTKLGREVALKFLPPELVNDAVCRQRFAREAQAASQLNHPNICVVHEVGEAQDLRPFIVMEFVEGCTLSERIKRGPMAILEIVDVAIQIADALDGAFAKRIVHRDLKPANISVNDRGLVKVLDFGLAKRMDLDVAGGSSRTTVCNTQAGQILGTPNYMSPEQATGRGGDHRGDLFSLGIVLYEMITGRLPFCRPSFAETLQCIVHAQPEAMARFNYEVPSELDRIVRKLLEKNPDHRFQTPRELLLDLKRLRRDLDELLAGRTTNAAPAAATPGVVASVRAPAVPAAPLSAEVLHNSDIFINYAQIDDQPVLAGREGWVSQFHRNLAVRVEQLSGEKVKMVCQAGHSDGSAVDRQYLNQLSQVKAMVSVVSPPFVKTAGCRREAEVFWQAAQQSGRLFIDNHPRMLNVVKTPVDPEDVPSSLASVFSRLHGFEFFDRDPETGRLYEFDEAFGVAAQQRYYERVYDLAHSIYQLLKRLRVQDAGHPTGSGLRSSGKTIFLAATTSDLQRQRDLLQRELIEAGHQVLPAQALPIVAADLEATVLDCLKECDLAIHLIGDRYGLVPEDTSLSVVALQNKWAAQASRTQGLERLIWIPRQTIPRDQRQEEFIRELTRDPELHFGGEVISETLESFKELIEERWRPKPAAAPASSLADAASDNPPRVYLICDVGDQEAIEPIEDYFYALGIEVITPAFDAEEARTQEIHIQNLKDCDAALVYYGTAGKPWVDIKVRDLTKANGYRDSKPISARAVYLAPPFDRRKERYQSLSAEVLRQVNTFEPALLDGFSAKLKRKESA